MKIVHEMLKLYQCKSCFSAFGFNSTLKRHMKTKCLGKNEAKKIVNSNSQMENTYTAKNKNDHSKIIEGLNKFCQICELKFTNKTDLEAHFQAVHNLNNNNNKRSPKDERKNKTEQFIVDNLCLPKSYTCDICDVSLSNKSTFEVHFQQIHNSILAFACDVCFERFPKEDTLSQHKQSCKNEVRKPS